MAEFRIIQSIHEVSATDWDRLNPSGYPFFQHAFLAALEDSGCVNEKSGWHPNYLIHANTNGQLDCAIPTFLKQHSYAEYVFDWSWADAYQRHGLDYYPKMLWAAPFTPATGPRLLKSPDSEISWADAIELITQLCEGNQLSGWHLNFLENDDVEALRALEGLSIRQACQFHWFNRGYTSFDHYLDHFTSRKRKSVRKERKKVIESGVTVERAFGSDISPDLIKSFYHCYQSTYLKRGRSGYLNKALFTHLLDSMADQMMLVTARREDTPIAHALYFFDQHTLYGRYWGCLEEVEHLHFEACYYQGIEFCIEQGLKHFDPGTQGEHKISRGFEPTLTYSAHKLMHPSFQQAVEQFVQEENDYVLRYQEEAASLLPFKEDAFPPPD
ncbi:MAG: GNAT family N-acetyltransferase [Oceanobacter sp.]